MKLFVSSLILFFISFSFLVDAFFYPQNVIGNKQKHHLHQKPKKGSHCNFPPTLEFNAVLIDDTFSSNKMEFANYAFDKPNQRYYTAVVAEVNNKTSSFGVIVENGYIYNMMSIDNNASCYYCPYTLNYWPLDQFFNGYTYVNTVWFTSTVVEIYWNFQNGNDSIVSIALPYCEILSIYNPIGGTNSSGILFQAFNQAPFIADDSVFEPPPFCVQGNSNQCGSRFSTFMTRKSISSEFDHFNVFSDIASTFGIPF